MAAIARAAFGVQHLAKGVSRLSNVVLAKGRGSYVWTTEGRKLLDFTSGIGVVNLGHCHPRVTQAAQSQLATLVHGQVAIAMHEPMLSLIEHLKPVMPDPSLDTFFFWNSGAEAVEAALKLARAATGRQNIVVMQGSYHGRTIGTMSMTRSKTIYGAGFGPFMPGVFTSPFPYCTQCAVANASDGKLGFSNCCMDPLHELKVLLKQQSAAADTAAIIIEPVLGEGGYVVPPDGFLSEVRKLCDEHGILLILDEVQSGFGRTGKYFAAEHWRVRPDIMVMAKGIANGLPLSGIVSRKELMDRQTPGSMGGTYAGNAVACAAGVACAQVMREERVLENVEERYVWISLVSTGIALKGLGSFRRSEQLFDALEELKASPTAGHLIKDVRGLGLMIGLEFNSPSFPTVTPVDDVPKGIAARVQAKCLENNLLTLTTSIYETIRFIPPLTVSEEEMKLGCDIFTRAVEDVAREG
ncbi:hypothetical protein DRE_06596 [Drechslerella stenobrocha 248]|uniref:4-aminobutyrate aminotransferase n=1 Tax=Drechslerella stenobrocha 248 TaxID=1043628 RepID=W7HWZ0_9PEZI|nr:hypothetical protein DRE_06596 [Drechslerella stenobrocha 248]